MDIVIDEDGIVLFEAHFLNKVEADHLFDYCYNNLPWSRDQITIFGKQHWIPRQHAYMADHQDYNYAYSGHQMKVYNFSPEINKLRKLIAAKIDANFNAMLANLYEHGQHSNGWHADNEKELGPNPVIASISLGATRKFKVKHSSKPLKEDILLTHGSLLVMKGAFQENWKHTIPKTAKKVEPRVNLTFRKIIS